MRGLVLAHVCICLRACLGACEGACVRMRVWCTCEYVCLCWRACVRAWLRL